MNSQSNPGDSYSMPFAVLRWILIVWSMFLAIWMYIYSIREGGLVCWDEYERCAWGASIWYDITHLDGYHFWKHTNTQMVWPFLHSWLTGTLFTLFGPSLASARLLALLSFWGCAVLIVLWFARQDRYLSRFGEIGNVSSLGPFAQRSSLWLGAMVAWGFFTMSPIVLQHAVAIMSEIVGLLLVLGVLVSIPIRDETRWRRWGTAGFVLGLLFVYKYNFAFLTWFGLFVYRFARARYSVRRLFSTANALLLGVPMSMLALWLLPDFKYKWQQLVGFAINNPQAHMPFTFESFLFYFQQVPVSFFAHPWWCVAGVSLIFFALPLSKRLSLSHPVVAVFLAHFTAAIVHPFKIDRFQFIPMGLFFILAGEAAQMLWSHLVGRWHKTAIIGGWTLILGLLTILMNAHTSIYRSPILPQEYPYHAPARIAVDSYQHGDRVGFLIADWTVTPPALNFEMIRTLHLPQRDFKKNRTYWAHLFLFQPGEPVRAKSPEERLRQLEHELYINKSNKIVVIETTLPWGVSPTDPVFSGVWEYIQLVPKLERFRLMEEREFEQSRVRVRVFAAYPQGSDYRITSF